MGTRRIVAMLIVSGAVGTPPELARAEGEPVLDQSFVSPENLGASIHECCALIAQTFTAGADGTLAGGKVDIRGMDVLTLDGTPVAAAPRLGDGAMAFRPGAAGEVLEPGGGRSSQGSRRGFQ